MTARPCSITSAAWGWRASCRSGRMRPIAAGRRRRGSSRRTRRARRCAGSARRSGAKARFSRLTNGCALECGVGFRQLRTCRRTRPGQLCARSPRPYCAPGYSGNPAFASPAPQLAGKDRPEFQHPTRSTIPCAKSRFSERSIELKFGPTPRRYGFSIKQRAMRDVASVLSPCRAASIAGVGDHATAVVSKLVMKSVSRSPWTRM